MKIKQLSRVVARLGDTAKPFSFLSCRFGLLAVGFLALADMPVAAVPAETNHAAIP